jgi:hypothetical protein
MNKILERFNNNQIDLLYSIGVYKIYFIGSKKFYIGSTISTESKKSSSKGFYNRFRRHLQMLKSNKHCNKHLQSAFNKYTVDNIKFEILFVSTDKNQILKKEQDLITSLNCTNRNIGYNIQPLVNKVQLLDIAHNEKKVCQYDLEGNLIKIWDSTRKAAAFYNVLPASIWNVLNGRCDLCKNSMWKYYNSDKIKIEPYKKLHKTRKKVKQYDLENNFIKEWKSLKDVAYFFNKNYNSGTFSNAIKTTGKYKGFIWKLS